MIVLVLVGCHPKPDRDAQCKEAIDHMRMVSTMPMREGDTAMVMGACKMWSQERLDCTMKAKDDAELEACQKLQ